MKDTRGFTLIEGLLILVIVGLLGGTGWYVWNAKKNTDNSLNTTAQTEVTTTSTKPEIPEGYIKYENKDLGFSFAYPKEWGTTTLQSKPETGLFLLLFNNKNPQVELRAQSRDTNIENSDSRYAKGYVDKDRKYYQRAGIGGDYLIESNNVLAVVDTGLGKTILVAVDNGLGPYIFLEGMINLENQKFPGINLSFIHTPEPEPTGDITGTKAYTSEDIEILRKVLATFNKF